MAPCRVVSFLTKGQLTCYYCLGDCASHAQEERHTSCRICGFLNIDNYVRRFNWGESTSHRVKWPTLTRSRRDGGLGIQSAREIQMLRCWANTYGLFCLMIKSFGQRCNFINILRTKMFSGLKRLQGVLIYGSQFLKLLRIFALARVTSSFGMIDGYLVTIFAAWWIMLVSWTLTCYGSLWEINGHPQRFGDSLEYGFQKVDMWIWCSALPWTSFFKAIFSFILWICS